MDYGYLGEVIAAFLVLLAFIVGAIVATAARYHISGVAGTVGHDDRFAERRELDRTSV